jgi:hypothetical protein
LRTQLESLWPPKRDPFVFYYRDAPKEGEQTLRVSLTCDSLHPSRETQATIACGALQGTDAGAISAFLPARNLGEALTARLSIRWKSAHQFLLAMKSILS